MAQGSPPRVRGKGAVKIKAQPQAGITPACAGKRLIVTSHNARTWDHPRVCGEKRPLHLSRFRGQGITPACAGKSRIHRVCTDRHRDHPRVCGEKAHTCKWLLLAQGSPPRVRGKVVFSSMWRRYMGITPACAGKRLKRSHSIGHFSCILCLFHSVLHRASVSGGSRAGPCAPPCLPAQNAVPV